MHIAVEVGPGSDGKRLAIIDVKDDERIQGLRISLFFYDRENEPSALGVHVEAGVADALLAWRDSNDVANVRVDGIDASRLGIREYHGAL